MLMVSMACAVRDVSSCDVAVIVIALELPMTAPVGTSTRSRNV